MADEDETLKEGYVPEHLREDPDVGRYLGQMQALSVEALALAHVHVRDEGSRLVYFTKKNGRELVEAEFNPRMGQWVWRGGHTTRQQDQTIRLHGELSRRR